MAGSIRNALAAAAVAAAMGTGLAAGPGAGGTRFVGSGAGGCDEAWPSGAAERAEPEAPSSPPATTQWENPQDDPLWKFFGPRPPIVKGKTLQRQCRADGGDYWLYVPGQYDPERHYPLVVSLHGIKPHDLAQHHVQMWGALADRHGYVVLAPHLNTCDSFGQFPLRRMGEAELKDVRHVLACMDEVAGDWEIDRGAVLLSSWSMGGYLAHYLAVEHGERFAAFAPLQSNFNAEVLDAAKARRRAGNLPVMIFTGTHDMPVIVAESKAAVEWYRELGFDVQVKSLNVGHERHPGQAAAFFEGVMDRRMEMATSQPDEADWSPVQIVVTPPGGEPAPVAVNLWPALSSRIGQVRGYTWQFGPLGGPSHQKSPNLLIRQPGEYAISLTVTDRAGRKFTRRTLLKIPAKLPGPDRP